MGQKILHPYRDRQQDPPSYFCQSCGGEVYSMPWEEQEDPGLCPQCMGVRQKRRQAWLTLREMAPAYRDEVTRLRQRVALLRQQLKATEDREKQRELEQRIRFLTTIWREVRDQAVLLERYYERGYFRNARYTV